MFTQTLQSILRRAGWTPDRFVSASEWVAILETECFTMLPEAVKILESFGGLRVVPQKTASDAYLAEALLFNPVMAATGEFDRVDFWQRRLNLRFSPLAEISGGAILLLADDGRVFACWDGLIWFEGTSFEDAMENTLVIPKRRPVEFDRVDS